MINRTARGELTIEPDGVGFLRTDAAPPDDLVYVSIRLIRRWNLRSGDRIAGPVRAAVEDMIYPALLDVHEINGRVLKAYHPG